MFWRALRLRCPLCGARGIFTRWGQLHDRCPGCGYSFAREEGYWVGGMIVNLGVAQILFMATFLTGTALTWPDVPWTALIAAGVVLMVGLPIWLYPRSKTLWIWLDLRLHPYADEERPEYRP